MGELDAAGAGAAVADDVAGHTTRERIIDAAEACFALYGIDRTRIEDVAHRADFARSTVYRYFEDREALILAVILHDAERFNDQIREYQETFDDPSDRIVEGILYVIELIRTDANLAAWFASPDAITFTTSVAGASDAIFETTSLYMAPLFEFAAESGRLRPDIDIDDAAEWLVRVVLSLLTVRGRTERGDNDLRRFLHTFLVPALLTDT